VLCLGDEAAAKDLATQIDSSVKLLWGEAGLSEISAMADICVNGVVGFAGLPVTLGALSHGRRLALANKESLIAAGPVVRAVLASGGGEILPVDSEHAAIHQCLHGDAAEWPRSPLSKPSVIPPGPWAQRSRWILQP
ncbi:MAG: 1-deoxy-D-xylulose-5-phosphate reductoisomerase, partial [Actinobacteria bacterium]|nr:1-deoxy-D-xylulose-5-phosphate reductoisomerase [Actinomycetota bacterium]